jgi:hypothetical protein
MREFCSARWGCDFCSDGSVEKRQIT